MQDAHATIADNMLHFGRVLRAAGLPVTPKQTADAIEATLAVGLNSRSRLYWALHLAFVKRHSEHELFDQAFTIFWRDPGYLKRMMSLMIPQTSAPPTPEQQKNLARRLSDALGDLGQNEQKPQPDTLDIDAVETFSSNQLDRTKDF
ncbi:MAG: VWA domain-containing protein, partial [Pseudomonadota bacterium]